MRDCFAIMTYKKKLIEVALPLNYQHHPHRREKSIRHGHPSTLHLWWARQPLAAARAVIFVWMVEQPIGFTRTSFLRSGRTGIERLRLLRMTEQLVLSENTTNEDVLRTGHKRKSGKAAGVPPALSDEEHPRPPRNFSTLTSCPPSTTPLPRRRAAARGTKRLGLKAYASDLNPVSVLHQQGDD